MEKLPLELHNEIICWVEPAAREEDLYRIELARYATISRTWQALIERYTFRKLKIRSDELGTFEKLFQGENIRRRALLKELSVNFILPDPPNANGCCDITRVPDRDADSRAFSGTVQELFIVLSHLEKRVEEPSPLALSFDGAARANTPRSDPPDPSGHGVYHFRCNIKRHPRMDVREARNTSGYYELRRLTMPILTAVDEFQFKCYELFSELRPTWIPIILQHLERVKILWISQRDDYSVGRTLRRAHRQEISQSLNFLPRDTLVEFYFNVRHTVLRNQDVSPHKLAAPGMWREDPWCRVYQHLADLPHLRKLHWRGRIVVCPEFFLNITEKSGACFPSLEELYLEIAQETADGNWFCDRDEETFVRARDNPKFEDFWDDHEGHLELDLDSEDDMEVFEDGPAREDVVRADRFRTVPNFKLFCRFLYDASRAFKRLKGITKFALTMPEDTGFIYPFLDRIFELWWVKGGVAGPHRSNLNRYFPELADDDRYLNLSRLYWRTGDWVPWAEVQDAWIEAAGPGTKVFHIGSENIESSDEDTDSD